LNFFIKNRIPFSFLVVIVLLVRFFVAQKRPFSVFDIYTVWGVVGAILLLFGVFFRSWAAGVIFKRKKLATVGPYALVRHPLYVGTFFIATGFIIILGDLVNIIVAACLVLFIYLPTIRKEEKINASKFEDEWTEYVNSVSFIGPKKMPSRLFSNWSFDQWKQNKEYKVVLTAITVIIVLELWNTFIV